MAQLQEKRYRSMQEHIRRAHPEHYISKLPATEESIQLMINTPPSERPPPVQAPTPAQPSGNPGHIPHGAIEGIVDTQQSTVMSEKLTPEATALQHLQEA